jgi:hypothetical protein
VIHTTPVHNQQAVEPTRTVVHQITIFFATLFAKTICPETNYKLLLDEQQLTTHRGAEGLDDANTPVLPSHQP